MAKKSKDIVFTSALRTAIGKYNGSLKEFRAHDLGKAVIKKILEQSKIEVINTNRGGETTFHGPGQLIGYFFIKIKDLNLTPISYVRLLEKMLVLSYLDYGLKTITLKGKTGVWVPGDKKSKKIAAIGVRISNGVTMHGF